MITGVMVVENLFALPGLGATPQSPAFKVQCPYLLV